MDPYNNRLGIESNETGVSNVPSKYFQQGGMSSAGNTNNLMQPLLTMANTSSAIVNKAVPQAFDSLQKNLGNIKNSALDKVGQIASFAMQPFDHDSQSKNLKNKVNQFQNPVENNPATGSENFKMATDLVSKGGDNIMNALGKAGNFINKNAGAVQSGFELGSDLLSYGGKQDKLKQTSNAIDKSIDILDNAKTEVGGANVENFNEIDSSFSENMQNNALQSMDILKKNMDQVPTSNLSSGNIKQVALETQEAIKTRLTSLYQNQKSKNEDIKKRLNQNANFAVSKANSSIDKLEAEKKKIEEAQSNNKLNLALSAGKVAANFLPGGPVVGQVVGMGLDQFKQSNEYS
jgi:hypothetical protein